MCFRVFGSSYKIIISVFLLIVALESMAYLVKPPRGSTSAAALSLFNRTEIDLQNEPENAPVAGYVKVPIFIYHSVRPYIPGESQIQDTYDITPELLEKQLIYLRDNGYTAVDLDELIRDVNNGTTTPISKPVILTFDDGWENQYTYAFPLLKKYHITATFYVFSNPISKTPHFFTWDQLREMSQAGMTIGSHTITHPYLQDLPPDELKREIAKSKLIIESEIGRPVLHFANPFGYTSPEIVDTIRQAGYATGRTTYKGIYHTKDSLLSLRGFLVDDRLEDFIKILNR